MHKYRSNRSCAHASHYVGVDMRFVQCLKYAHMCESAGTSATESHPGGIRRT